MLYRYYNSNRDDYAIFPVSKLIEMKALNYALVDDLSGTDYEHKLGYVYINEDSDNDKLIDGFERILGTCLYDHDTDNDGINDGDEVLSYPRKDPISVVSSCDNSSAPEYAWQDNAVGTLYTNYNWYYALGYHFTPQVNGKIDKLGGYFKGTKLVKLFNKNTGALLSEIAVSADNNWAYSSISPISVQAGVEYTVAVYMQGIGGSYRAVGSGYFPKTFDNITITGSTYIYTGSSGSARPTNVRTNAMYGQADFRFLPN